MHAFEELTGSINLSSGMAINHLSGNSLLGVLEGPELQTNQLRQQHLRQGQQLLLTGFPLMVQAPQSLEFLRDL